MRTGNGCWWNRDGESLWIYGDLTDIATEVRSALPVVSATARVVLTPTSAPTVQVAGTVVNLRSGPGLEYAILGQVSAGDQLSALGISAGGQWLQVARDGEGHWIYADLTDIKADQHHRLPKIPAADRAIAAEPSPSVAQVPLSAHLPVGAIVRLGRGTVSVAQYSPADDYLAVGGWRRHLAVRCPHLGGLVPVCGPHTTRHERGLQPRGPDPRHGRRLG